MIFFFIEEVEKALLRSLSPVKKDESNEVIDFLNSFLSKSEEKPITFPSIHQEDSNSKSCTVSSTFDGRTSSTSEGDYKPSPDLLDLFNTLPDELVSTARKDAVVKSEILDTVLRYGTLCFLISLMLSLTLG